jgi:hypothetical protein
MCSSVYAIKAYWGDDKRLHSFLTLTLGGGEWSAARPGRVTPDETPSTHWVEGWVGSRASLEPLEAGKISCPYQKPRFFSPWFSRYTD